MRCDMFSKQGVRGDTFPTTFRCGLVYILRLGNCRRERLAGYDDGKRRKWSKVHAALDTPANLLTMLETTVIERDREQVGELA